MPVSQRDEVDSLDSMECGTGGSDLELAPPEQQSDRWSVFSVYEGESASVSGQAVPKRQMYCCSVSSDFDREIIRKTRF